MENQKPEALGISVFLSLNYIIGSLKPLKGGVGGAGTKSAKFSAVFHQGSNKYKESSNINGNLMRKGKFPNHQKFLAVLLLYGTSVKRKKKKKTTTKINKKKIPGRN